MLDIEHLQLIVGILLAFMGLAWSCTRVAHAADANAAGVLKAGQQLSTVDRIIARMSSDAAFKLLSVCA